MIVKVTCALIEQFGRVLVTQRSEKMSQPMLWEFPGGKLELGESEEACLIREIKEELNLDITPLERLTPVIQPYAAYTIELIPFICRYDSGAIRPTEHKSYQWASPNELPAYDWCPADVPIVDEYLAKLSLLPS
jgi:8-oxo-dGTP diphosphatase